jgi:hypothetical protein
MSRIRHPRKDENHHIVRDFMKVFCGGFEVHKFDASTAYTANFRGRKFIAYDLADVGGVAADWLLECVSTSQFLWIEVKTPDTLKQDGDYRAGTFKEGEEWLRDNSSSWMVVINDDDVKGAFEVLS